MSATAGSSHIIYFALKLLTSFVVISHASQFRGGLMHLATVGPISRTTGLTVDVTQRYGWRRSYGRNTYCDASTIASGQIIADVGYLRCIVGCPGSLSVGVYCTDFSVTGDWTVGERVQRVWLPFAPVIEASFASTAWIDGLVKGGGSGWEVRAKLNLNAILAKRTENSSPETKMTPIVNLLHGCNHTIAIPVEDADGDVVRCRWAESRFGECGGVCQALPGAVLNGRDCTIFYSATGAAGLYAVAIQIEDFDSAIDTLPFSSVPLQFIVNVYEAEFGNVSCYAKPTFSWPTRRDGACVGIPLDSTFHEAIIAESGVPDISVQDIVTQSPPGVRISGLAVGPGTNNWYVNITWTPVPSQVGNHIFCFTAVDSNGANSYQNCITFAVGTYPPALKNGSLFPTGELIPSNSNWRIEFDRQFVRPRRSAYIRFHDETDAQIFVIDTSTNANVTFPTSPTDFSLAFLTAYTFKEKVTYYITIDHGVAYGTEACGPESVGMFDPHQWRFTIKDVTPPVLTFLPYKMYSSGSIDIVWTYDETATSTCLVQGPQSVFRITCNDTLTLSNMTEGDFTLFVQASDVNGNAKQYQTGWYVDLKAPLVSISSKPPPIINTLSAVFRMTCSDRSSCQLWCADHAPNQTEPTFAECSFTYTAFSRNDGMWAFSVYGVDEVGNVGERLTYTWTVDTIVPTISPVADKTVACGSPYDPQRTGFPEHADSTDRLPSLTYNDTLTTGCRTVRTWTVTDHAGNTANVTQIISFSNIIPPSVGGTEELFVPCGETDRLASPDYVVKALNITSPCGRRVTVDYTNSRPITDCGITVTRQWVITDDCGSVVHFTQTIHVLFQTFPDFPANGQLHVTLSPRLGWPLFPQSQGFSVYVWQYGSAEPEAPASFVPLWRRTYTFADTLYPNTRYLWRIGYIVPFGNSTREISSPTWGFQTESYADLSLISVQVPPTAFSGSSFTVMWVVENVGNVSTSHSTSIYYDAIYLSRSSQFSDAYESTVARQHRYVDPKDGYTFSGDVNLQPSDIGNFYVFVVIDVRRHIEDFSTANNRRLAVQPIHVQLTPPPNLQVKSAIAVYPVIHSGRETTVRITIANSGDGITQVARWYDRLFLSVDDQRSNDDQDLTTRVHNGALASGQQYETSIAVTIPNAIYGVYYIIVSTDIYDDVFEHTDDNDNDFALEISITLSEFPDLVVLNITVPKVATTGDTVPILVVIRNAGSGEPFEYWWRDAVKITSITDNITIFSAVNQYIPGRQQFVHDSTYVSLFQYTVAPTARSGDYNVTVMADVLNEVFEFQSNDNNDETVVMRINQILPDLTLGPSSAVIIENDTGNYMTLSISMLNSGPGEPQIASWENEVMLSTSQTTIKLISFFSPNSFFQNSLVSNLTTYISSSLVGFFDVSVSIDSKNQVLEVNESNNYMVIERVNLRERVPDIALKSVNATNHAQSGSVIVVTWTVENVGNLPSRRQLSWFDEITLTAESGMRISLSRVLISFSDDFQSQQNYERQLNVTIPNNLAGSHRLGVTTALYESRNVGVELNRGNNYMEIPLAISTPPSPDFQPTSCGYDINSRFATRLLSVVCTVRNVGNSMDKPMNWTDRISLVNFDGSAVLTTYVTGIRKLSFGDTYASSATMVLSPAIYGHFQIAVQVDSAYNVTEIGGEDNNALRVSSRVYIPAGPSPHLSVSIEPLKQSLFNSGETLSVNYSVTNTGEADLASSTWTDSLFVFFTPGATKQQVMLSGFLISSVINNNYQLKIGASYSESFGGLLPHSIRGPTYVYVVTDVNSRLPIRSRSSDRAVHLSTTIDVQPGPLPDLEISLTGNMSTVRVQSGQMYELKFTVSNVGNASASGIWYDAVYLSHEKLIDPFDIALKTALRPHTLDKGETYTHIISFVIPFDLPAVAYYFIVTTNVRKEVFESSFDNNNDYQLTEIVVLPAVDLVVMNITSSVTNATYSENVNFQWTVANNGSIATFGYKCDSVYLSSDDVWHITDVTVVGPICGRFSLDQKGSASDFSIYESTGKIPPVAKGSYKSIVRTRSNVKDNNLVNNIGVSVLNMSVNPPTISIGENKTYDFITNEDRTFELTNIPVGIGLIVRLNTLYELAYHGLFIKRNSPPAAYDYDVAYRQIGTTQQTVYLPYTKSGDYYLLVESASAAFKQPYQVSLSVREAKFEVTYVYPSLLATAATASIRISGTLFGRKLRAFLTNDSEIQTAATKIYRYTSEEAYATFNSRELSVGTYGVLLEDVGRNQSYELQDAVVVSGLAVAGKLQVDLLTPRALRPGRPGIIDVKIDNAGYSDVSMPLLLLTAEQNIKLLSTQSDVGVLPSENIFFFPLSKNRPPSIILPKSTAVYSFRAIPDDEDFVGDVSISLYVAKDELLLAILRKFKLKLKPSNVADDVWNIVWRNVEQCFGSEPTSLLRTISGRFTQHYAAVNSVDNLIGHVVGVADGAVPRLVLSESVDVEDRSYSSSLILRIVRTYPHQLTVRRTVGLFGRSWSSPVLEMAVSVHANSVLLIKQRQEFNFTSMDDDGLYSNHRLPSDRIKINNTAATYISKGISYVFDVNSGLLERITDETEVDFISITYNVNNMPVRLTHQSSGSTISVVYGSNGFISSTELMQSGVVLSKVYYSYNDDGYLTSVAGVSVTEYQYTADGDLSLIVQGQRRTEITYDVMYLMAQTVDYYGDAIIQKLRIHRHCDGSIERTVLPQNQSSIFVFGLSGKLIENSAVDGLDLPVNIRRDNVRDEVYVTVGDELKQTHSFDRSSRTYFIANANDEKLVVKLRPDGRVRSIGDTQSAYYDATYTGDRVSAVRFRDGKRQKFTYNEQGQRTSATLRDGSRIIYNYDDKQHVSVVQTSSGRYVYNHNSDGLLTAVSAPDGGTTTLAYNRQRLPISVVYPDGTSLRYTYNECGQRSSVTSNTGYKSSYVYDSSCRLSKVVDGSGSVVAAYEYGQHSQVAKKELGNRIYTEYTYENGSLRLQQLRNFFPDGTLMSYYSYVHNEWGNRVETETHEGIWKYRYDAIGQLIEWRSPFSDEYENIEYSSNLNRKYKQTATDKLFYNTNSLHQYTKYGNAENFTYDVNGNLLSKSTVTGTSMHVEQFAYDQLGHCTTVTAGEMTCRYQYDVFGAVSAKNCSNGKYTKYLVDPFGTYGTNILEEQTESGHKRMHYGQEHGLIASLESADTRDAVFYVFDGDGSTIQTASQSGELLTSYAYDPFGRELSLSRDDVNLFRFLGLYGIPLMTETADILRIRNRLYDSEHGRFISPDPTGVFGSPINPYTYAINSPLMFKDTNGLVPLLPAVGLVGRTLLYKIGKEAVIGGIKGANIYLWKLHLSGDKFDWREFAKATGTSALNSAITSVNPFDSLSSKFIFSFVATLLTGGDVLDALESGAVNVLPEKLRPFYDLYRAALDAYVSKHTKNRKLTDLIKNGFMRWVRSIDPNEITGPVGYGDANYISADQSLMYKIEFENNPNATAPAQKVIIRCPIDSNLELGTFKVGLVRFDVYEKDFQFRSSRVHLSRIDATDKTGTFVEVHVFIDPVTKEAVWLLRSIDPLTGLPPSNPLVGFLPPNNGTNGQGYVTFSINIKRSVQSLAKITENANIVFDENPHIDTSTIFHTVDKTAGTVSMNVSTLTGSALVNLVTEDVGSGVKSVDLYLVVDGSLRLIKSDIKQSVVIVELPENVRHTVVGVSTDNVGNSGSVDTSGSVDVYVPMDCPAECSGRGQCGSGGLCICDSGYAGYNCSLNLTLSCEPPILEVSYSDNVHNDSLVVFISARSSQPEPAESLSVKIACVPNDTVLSRGRLRSDGVYYLEKTDFGNVLFTTPDWFYGLLVCTINATVVDVCGTNVRRILMVTDVVGPEDQTTVKTDAVTADHGTTPTAGRDITTASIPITAATSSLQQSPGISGKTRSATGTSSYFSQPDDRTTHRTTLGAAGVSEKSRTATETSSYISQPGDRTTDRTTLGVLGVSGRTRTATETSSYISQPGDRTTDRTTLGVLSVSGRTRTTTETSSYISQPGNRRTHRTTLGAAGVSEKSRTATETSAYISQPGDRATHRTTLGAADVSGRTRSATGTSSYISQPGDRTTDRTTLGVLGVSGRTRTATETSAYISQPSDRATHRTTLGAAGVNEKTGNATETSSYISQPGDRTTHRTTMGASGVSEKIRSATETSAYISHPGDRTTARTSLGASVTITKVAADISEGTTSATSWDVWSDWTPCSRSCDTGVQERTRQCLLSSPENCGPESTDRRFCKLSTCPGMPSI